MATLRRSVPQPQVQPQPPKFVVKFVLEAIRFVIGLQIMHVASRHFRLLTAAAHQTVRLPPMLDRLRERLVVSHRLDLCPPTR